MRNEGHCHCCTPYDIQEPVDILLPQLLGKCLQAFIQIIERDCRIPTMTSTFVQVLAVHQRAMSMKRSR